MFVSVMEGVVFLQLGIFETGLLAKIPIAEENIK